MGIIKIILTATGSFIVLFILTKLMGKRQMSQLSMFDYVVGISIGSIAAEMATSLDGPFTRPLTAMVVYALLSILTAFIINKSLPVRKKIEGMPVILFDNGKIYRENFKKNKVDLDEFLMMCRNMGYFDLSTIQTVVLEQNGTLSVLPKAVERPASPKDLNLFPAQDMLVTNVIMDGEIMSRNLSLSGRDESWLKDNVINQGAKSIEDVFLATIDSSGMLNVYLNFVPYEEDKKGNKLLDK